MNPTAPHSIGKVFKLFDFLPVNYPNISILLSYLVNFEVLLGFLSLYNISINSSLDHWIVGVVEEYIPKNLITSCGIKY